MALIITRERVADLVVLARLNGHAGHLFGNAGSVGLTWSHAMGRVLLSFHSAAGWSDQIWLLDVGIEAQIWAAINERLPWLTAAPTEVNA